MYPAVPAARWINAYVGRTTRPADTPIGCCLRRAIQAQLLPVIWLRNARSSTPVVITCCLLPIRNWTIACKENVPPSDVVQNTLIKAVEHFADFQGTNQHALLAWVRQILKNEIIDVRRAYLRAEKRDLRKECPPDDDALLATERPEIVDPEHTPSTHAELRDDAERLQRALQLLSPDYEAVIRMRNWERLPFAEIGRRMNRSEDAAKKLESAVIAGIRSANVLRARAGLTTQEIIPVQFAKSLPRWPFGN